MQKTVFQNTQVDPLLPHGLSYAADASNQPQLSASRYPTVPSLREQIHQDKNGSIACRTSASGFPSVASFSSEEGTGSSGCDTTYALPKSLSSTCHFGTHTLCPGVYLRATGPLPLQSKVYTHKHTHTHIYILILCRVTADLSCQI